MEPTNAFPLFKGITRLPTVLGVPIVPFIMMLMAVAVLALIAGVFWWLIAIPLWLMMKRITRHDDRAFRVWALWFETQGRNRLKLFWGASSYAPTSSSWRLKR